MRVFSMLSSLMLSDIGALVSVVGFSVAVVSAMAISKLAAPLFRKMMLARASCRWIFRMTISPPPNTDAKSTTKLRWGAFMSVSLAKESFPTILRSSMPKLRLGKLRIKLRDRSGLKLTVAFKFLLAAVCTADTILPLNAKGSINKAAKSTARVIPVIFKVLFQFMSVDSCKNKASFLSFCEVRFKVGDILEIPNRSV